MLTGKRDIYVKSKTAKSTPKPATVGNAVSEGVRKLGSSKNYKFKE